MAMFIKQFLAFGIFALGVTAVPQATTSNASPIPTSTASVVTGTGVSPSQSSAFESALSSYYSSVRGSPQFSKLAIAIGIADSDAAAVLEASPSLLLPITGGTSVDLRSLATAPPLSFSSLSLYSDWNPLLVSSVQAMQTSVVLDIASIDQSILGVSASISVPTPSSTSSGGAGQAMAKPTGVAAMGAAVGALGAAVAFL